MAPQAFGPKGPMGPQGPMGPKGLGSKGPIGPKGLGAMSWEAQIALYFYICFRKFLLVEKSILNLGPIGASEKWIGPFNQARHGL